MYFAKRRAATDGSMEMLSWNIKYRTMSDFGFVNRRDAVPRANPSRPRPPQGGGMPQRTAGGGPPPARPPPPPRGAPAPRGRGGGGPRAPAPVAPPLRKVQIQEEPDDEEEYEQHQPVVTPVQPPVSILRRPAPPATTSLYPKEEDAAPSADVKALIAQVESLKATVDDLSKRLNTETKNFKNATTQFFGQVGSDRALLFENIPKEFSVENASAKADKNSWVKLSYPQSRVERTLPNGTTQVDMWLRAYAIDAVTSDISTFWVRERAEDNTPVFKRFTWYPNNTSF